MDQVAGFVDAGYLLAATGSICHGTTRRSDLEVEYGGLVEALAELATTQCDLPLLRLYWYDAARGGVPARDHLEVARLANVKLRLGRLVERRGRFEQKGVDSLIIRDLMTLARERAIAAAYIVGGDEDLREGIAAVQDMGVRVAIAGIEADEQNQAESLLMEADESAFIDREVLARYITKRQAEIEVVRDESDIARARRVGHDFARACVENLGRARIGALLTDYPRIPSDLDVQLLKDASAALDANRIPEELKFELRAAFWDGLSEAIAEPAPDANALA